MTLTYNGHTYGTDEMTGALAVVVGDLVGDRSWKAIDYEGSPHALTAWLAVLDAQRTGRDLVEVLGEVQTMPLGALLACVTPGRTPTRNAAPKPTKRTTPRKRK